MLILQDPAAQQSNIIYSHSLMKTPRFWIIFKSSNKSNRWLADVLQSSCSLKFCNVQRRTHVMESLFDKAADLQVFSSEYCEILRIAFLYRTPPVAASLISETPEFRQPINLSFLLLNMVMYFQTGESHQKSYQLEKLLSRMSSVKKEFSKISQNSQENACARVSFSVKLQS